MFTSLGRTQENFVYALFGLVSDCVMKVSTQKTTSGPDEKLDTFNAIFSGEWNGMEWFAWTLRPYCLTADISWKSKKPPWPGVSKVLGYNPSIRTSQNWVICQFNKLANHPATVGDSLPFRCNSFMNKSHHILVCSLPC